MEAKEKAQKHLYRGHEYFFSEPPNMGAAAREFRRATKLAPEWAEGYGWLPSALREINQIDEAIAAGRVAIRLAPEDPRHHISLGVIFLGRKDYSKAIRAFRKGIGLKMHYGEADAQSYAGGSLICRWAD